MPEPTLDEILEHIRANPGVSTTAIQSRFETDLDLAEILGTGEVEGRCNQRDGRWWLSEAEYRRRALLDVERLVRDRGYPVPFEAIVGATPYTPNHTHGLLNELIQKGLLLVLNDGRYLAREVSGAEGVPR